MNGWQPLGKPPEGRVLVYGVSTDAWREQRKISNQPASIFIAEYRENPDFAGFNWVSDEGGDYEVFVKAEYWHHLPDAPAMGP